MALLLFASPDAGFAQKVEVEAPEVVLVGLPFTVTVHVDDTEAVESLQVQVATQTHTVPVIGGSAVAQATASSFGDVAISVRRNEAVIAQAATRAIPGWFSVLPPLLVILLALATKRVIPSLFFGLWIGAWGVLGLTLTGLWAGLLDTFEVYVHRAVADPDHVALGLFTFMIGGMVGIISKNGGMQGVVNKISGWADTTRRGQLATAFLGLIIFFDDYSNTLVVGNTMRPVTDRLRISREKLAYLVDSTAAPVATIAVVTTWIGFQVGLIGDAIDQIAGYDENAYLVFLNSIPYSFYPFLAIFMVLAVTSSGRDFGPMLHAERRARTTGQVLAPEERAADSGESEELRPKTGRPNRAVNAVLPILVLVVGMMGGLYVTGIQEAGDGATLREIISQSDSYRALMWASLLAVLAASVLSLAQRILSLNEVVEAWYSGCKTMFFALIILVMAWALSNITEVLQTTDYLIAVMGDTLSPGLLPALTFVLATATAFATGSSWGIMAILVPLVVPLAWAVLDANGMADPEHYDIMYATVACIMSGAVWGDHCSPIADTTILSSMAARCNHIDHVRTQLPYAMVAGAVALFLGVLPAGFGFPWWASLLLGIAVLAGILRYWGRPVEAM